MNFINLEKLSKINKEEIKDSQRFTTDRKMTDDILKSALNDALLKIDKLWEDVHGNFPSESSKGNIYSEVENIYGWNEGFFTGMLWLAYEATGDENIKKELFPKFQAMKKELIRN